MSNKVAILIPVYNDWLSLRELIAQILRNYNSIYSFHFVIVDDSSSELINNHEFADFKCNITLIELTRNMGHQKAIASGLSYIHDHLQVDFILVMDSDGEDRPENIDDLIQEAKKSQKITFARRIKRTEGVLFRLFYSLYKLVFILLTGKKISFGNYSIIPFHYLQKVVQVPDIWNHFSGGIIRSGIPYNSLPTNRGRRYYGKSKMNFTRLILHGLSAVSVYADIMAVRLILVSFLLIIATAIGIFLVASVRLFTDLAIPGWATFTVLGLAIILFLSLLLGLLLLFNVLNMKTQKSIIPAKDYKDYILTIYTLSSNE
jgi:glycosyltransferase involved in cell wall biosynthesis